MTVPGFLASLRPNTRAGLSSALATIIAVRREAMDYHDTVLTAQADGSQEDAAALEQAQQTMGAMVRELGALLEQAKKVQGIGDQLDRVLTDLRNAA